MRSVVLVGLEKEAAAGAAEVLERHGHNVQVLQDDSDLVRQVRASPPDVILTKLLYPGGDAFLLLDSLSNEQQLSGIPVLIVTSIGADGEPIRGWDGAVGGYLLPPVNHWHIVLAVEQALNRCLLPSDHEPLQPVMSSQAMPD